MAWAGQNRPCCRLGGVINCTKFENCGRGSGGRLKGVNGRKLSGDLSRVAEGFDEIGEERLLGGGTGNSGGVSALFAARVLVWRQQVTSSCVKQVQARVRKQNCGSACYFEVTSKTFSLLFTIYPFSFPGVFYDVMKAGSREQRFLSPLVIQ